LNKIYSTAIILQKYNYVAMDQEIRGISEYIIGLNKLRLKTDDHLLRVYFIMRYPDKPKLVFYHLESELFLEMMPFNILPGFVKLRWAEIKDTRPPGTDLIAVVLIGIALFEPKDNEGGTNKRNSLLTSIYTKEKVESLRTFYDETGAGLQFEAIEELEITDSTISNLYPVYGGKPVVENKEPINNIIKRLKEQAQKTFRKNHGKIEPKLYFILLYPNQQTPVYYPIPCTRFMSIPELQLEMPAFVQMCWFKKQAEAPAGIQLLAVCLISDTWVLNKREEALSVYMCFPEESAISIIPYIRKGKNIEYQQGDIQENVRASGGPLLQLYPKLL
jgi:hypothetical protein